MELALARVKGRLRKEDRQAMLRAKAYLSGVWLARVYPSGTQPPISEPSSNGRGFQAQGPCYSILQIENQIQVRGI
jgi:hypothetical protein